MLKNYVLETASAPGTSAGVTLAGPPAGRVSFVSQFGSGATCFYFATDDTQAEAGICTLTGGPPDTLTRPSSVLWNTAGTTSRLNFTGAVRFYNEVPAGNMLWKDGSGNVAVAGQLQTVTAGVLGSDAPRMDQTETLVQMQTGALSTAEFALPSGFSDFRLDWVDAGPASAAALVVQFSTDGGSTYHGSSGDYSWFRERSSPGAVAHDSNASDTLIQLTPTLLTGELQAGSFRFTMSANFLGSFEVAGMMNGTFSKCVGAGRCTFTGPVTNIRFAPNSIIAFSSARVRLFGRFS